MILRQLLRRQPRVAHFVHMMRQTLSADTQQPQVTKHGFRMAAPKAVLDGAFEQDEIAVVETLLGACDRFIDVGANAGLYSCLARSKGVPVVAIEPLQDNLRLLLANLVMNGWPDTEVVAAGLAEAPGIAELYGSGTGASLVSGWATLPENTLLRQRIPLTTLDAVIGERFAKERLLIKVDVEGAELGALKGATKILDRTPAPVWLVEICLDENFPGGQNPNFAATFDMLFSRGYKAVSADLTRRPVTKADIDNWTSAGHAIAGGYNYLFSQ